MRKCGERKTIKEKTDQQKRDRIGKPNRSIG